MPNYYDLRLKTGENTYTEHNHLKLKQLRQALTQHIEDNYPLLKETLKINNDKIYNLLNPNRRCSQALRSIATITRNTDDEQDN